MAELSIADGVLLFDSATSRLRGCCCPVPGVTACSWMSGFFEPYTEASITIDMKNYASPAASCVSFPCTAFHGTYALTRTLLSDSLVTYNYTYPSPFTVCSRSVEGLQLSFSCFYTAGGNFSYGVGFTPGSGSVLYRTLIPFTALVTSELTGGPLERDDATGICDANSFGTYSVF